MKNQIKLSGVLLLAILFAVSGCAQSQKTAFKSQGKINYTITADETAMLDSIQKKTFLFFLNEHHPEMGIVKDRAASWAPASIASTGFEFRASQLVLKETGSRGSRQRKLR